MRRWAATGLSLMALACDEVPDKIQVAQNVAPVARIDAPSQVGRGDLVAFDGTRSKDDDGRLDRYQWDFGDQTATASTARTFHSYAEVGRYEVKLTVTDNRGETDSSTHAITVLALAQNQPPVARIVAPATGNPGQPITLDASGSSDPDGFIRSFEWSIDGSLAARGEQVSHTFTAAGSHTVVLTVTDDRGAQSTATHSIDIGMIGNRPPVANAGPDRTVNTGDTVMFDGSTSFDPDGRIVSYEWTFGDGARASGSAVQHVYNTQNAFRVRLTVTDDLGLTGTDTATVTIGQESYDGNYTMEANPSMQFCSISPATFVATTIAFTAMGSALRSETPNPENPGGAPVVLTGTLTGASFSVSGNWVDSQSGNHAFTINGTFANGGYTATMTEVLSLGRLTLCTLTWNLSGTKLN